mmetsp:Transcript_59537/g.143755  ORF Transcript_59537/g.143755 Transcript_59537/m.143755 type:complete len:322 (+) Transcript_59537:113-1078(+)
MSNRARLGVEMSQPRDRSPAGDESACPRLPRCGNHRVDHLPSAVLELRALDCAHRANEDNAARSSCSGNVRLARVWAQIEHTIGLRYAFRQRNLSAVARVLELQRGFLRAVVGTGIPSVLIRQLRGVQTLLSGRLRCPEDRFRGPPRRLRGRRLGLCRLPGRMGRDSLVIVRVHIRLLLFLFVLVGIVVLVLIVAFALRRLQRRKPKCLAATRFYRSVHEDSHVNVSGNEVDGSQHLDTVLRGQAGKSPHDVHMVRWERCSAHGGTGVDLGPRRCKQAAKGELVDNAKQVLRRRSLPSNVAATNEGENWARQRIGRRRLKQ